MNDEQLYADYLEEGPTGSKHGAGSKAIDPSARKSSISCAACSARTRSGRATGRPRGGDRGPGPYGGKSARPPVEPVTAERRVPSSRAVADGRRPPRGCVVAIAGLLATRSSDDEEQSSSPPPSWIPAWAPMRRLRQPVRASRSRCRSRTPTRCSGHLLPSVDEGCRRFDPDRHVPRARWRRADRALVRRRCQRDYPTMTVTIQQEGAGPESSGRVALTGNIPTGS